MPRVLYDGLMAINITADRDFIFRLVLQKIRRHSRRYHDDRSPQELTDAQIVGTPPRASKPVVPTPQEDTKAVTQSSQHTPAQEKTVEAPAGNPSSGAVGTTQQVTKEKSPSPVQWLHKEGERGNPLRTNGDSIAKQPNEGSVGSVSSGVGHGLPVVKAFKQVSIDAYDVNRRDPHNIKMLRGATQTLRYIEFSPSTNEEKVIAKFSRSVPLEVQLAIKAGVPPSILTFIGRNQSWLTYWSDLCGTGLETSLTVDDDRATFLVTAVGICVLIKDLTLSTAARVEAAGRVTDFVFQLAQGESAMSEIGKDAERALRQGQVGSYAGMDRDANVDASQWGQGRTNGHPKGAWKAASTSNCYKCGRPGHIAKYCTNAAPGSGRGQGQIGWFFSRVVSSKELFMASAVT